MNLPPESPKFTKEQAHYGPTIDQSTRCDGCINFRDGTCAVVEGAVADAGWCDLWWRAPALQE